MDGPEGERHVELGARIIHRLFDPQPRDVLSSCHRDSWKWQELCLFHSRFAVETVRVSLEKAARGTAHEGIREHFLRDAREIREYRRISLERGGKYWEMNLQGPTARQWYREVQEYIGGWVLQRLPKRPSDF